jgi:hypothetical protein
METRDRYIEATLSLARFAADVANFCDHVEHNEAADRRWVIDAGTMLRRLACQLAADEGLALQDLYAVRLQMIEQRTPLWTPDTLDGPALAKAATTWRELQLAQVAHYRTYHLDVVGLAKFDQLRHCALHLAKLAGAAASVAQGIGDVDDFRARRLPDVLLFGLKLATIMGERLEQRALADEKSRIVVNC